MKRHKCRVCGYLYDQENGDAAGGIEPGTPFEELPDNWKCPVCGAGTEEFKPAD
ncbi:MAG: rubredoxin [Marinilabiliales bacterium]|nr:MAG: rubredoxin [Marinilabiliales bacterium]